jgi:hypothetical protein
MSVLPRRVDAYLPSLEERRNPAFIARWQRAMERGKREAIKCEHVCRDGHRCQGIPMREARRMNVNLCRLHLHGAKRDLVDVAREQRLLREAQSENKIKCSEAVRSLAAIARRRMHRSWKIDPRLPGATVPVLQERDAQRVERWLLERGFRNSLVLPRTGRFPTPRFWDRVSWAAVLALGNRLSEAASRRRLELALKDEVAFWKRLEVLGGDIE